MTKKVAIIGAGLAGLSTGIYLQKSGIETEIFELANWAGGVCTTWERQGYRFDGCIHWMVGTKPGTYFYDLYREVGALEEDTVIYNADSIKMELKGVMYEIPLRMPEFRSFLHSLSKQDTKIIDSFCNDVDKMIHSKMPGKGPSNLSDLIKLLTESRGFMTIMPKYIGMTVNEFVAPLKSDQLKTLLCALMPGDYSMTGLVMMLGTRMSGDAGYPLGGALGVIQRIESNYRSLGGTIHFHSKVDKIIIESGKATGVQSNGEIFPADYVVAACDAHDTLAHMLGSQFPHPQLNKMLETTPLFDSIGIISFGLEKKFDLPFAIDYEVPEGIGVAPGVVNHGFGMRSFDFDPAAAPENCSSVMVMTALPLEYWQKLRESNLTEYKAQKEKLADAVALAIDRRIPGFKKAIKVIDVATPATYIRLANLYKASFEGFAPTPEALKTTVRKTIPGVKNLVLCGQWTTPGGGICTAICSGKDTAEYILHHSK